MNSYRCSDGSKISQEKIDIKIKQAKLKKLQQQSENHGYYFCENDKCHKSTGVILDCSHIISVKKAKEMGKAELCFDVKNIAILCRECHEKHDKLNVQFNTL